MATLPRWQLRLTRALRGRPPELVEFRCNDLSVGRSACELALPGATVSRRHCGFRVSDDGRLVVTDRSTNGTFLNGQRLAHGVPTTLQVGDTLTIGDWRLELDAAPELVVAVMARSARMEAERDRRAGLRS